MPDKTIAEKRRSEDPMFSRFFRKPASRRYVWRPAVNFRDGRAMLTLMTFTGN